MNTPTQHDLSVTPTINSNQKTRTVSKVLQTDRPDFKPQFLAAFICCLAPLSAGMVGGFTSPAIPDMRLPGRSLPLTRDAESWLSSLMSIGGLCGGLIAGMAMDFFGRKSCLIYTAALNVFGWLFIVHANAYVFLYIGRFLTGVCTGLTCGNAVVYLGEIASPQIRGILGIGFKLFLSLGILLAYTIGAFVPWSYLAVTSATFPLLHMVLMSFMPETPVWLVRQGRIDEALKSIKWLRGSNYNYVAEIEDITNSQQNTASKTNTKEFLQPYFLKPFLLIEALMFFQQFTGYTAIIFYASAIFKAAGGTIDPNIQAIIIGVVMVISNVTASLFVDRVGRRLLLLTSTSTTSISMFVTGGYYYLLATDSQTATNVSWVPMICLIVFVLMFNFGLGPIPWLLMSELFPIQVRGFASSLIIATDGVFVFTITKTFGNMLETLHPYGTFGLFGICAVGATVFIWLFVPETKGKSLEEIQEIYSKQK